MIISEIQSEIGHCSCDSAKFKAPADFSHHAILCMTLSLTCWWVLDHSFWVSKCPKKMGTALKRHKLSIDVIVTLHVHHKLQQINTRYKILQKDITMYLLQSFFIFLFF